MLPPRAFNVRKKEESLPPVPLTCTDHDGEYEDQECKEFGQAPRLKGSHPSREDLIRMPVRSVVPRALVLLALVARNGD